MMELKKFKRVRLLCTHEPYKNILLGGFVGCIYICFWAKSI